jgi:hypothetical protein
MCALHWLDSRFRGNDVAYVANSVMIGSAEIMSVSAEGESLGNANDIS